MLYFIANRHRPGDLDPARETRFLEFLHPLFYCQTNLVRLSVVELQIFSCTPNQAKNRTFQKKKCHNQSFDLIYTYMYMMTQ